MNPIDVDDTICRCATGYDRIYPPVYQVDIDGPEPVWICINCLIGLEEW